MFWADASHNVITRLKGSDLTTGSMVTIFNPLSSYHHAEEFLLSNDLRA